MVCVQRASGSAEYPVMRPNGQTVRNGKNLNMALAMHGYDVLLYPVALTSLGYGREVRLSVKISENWWSVATLLKVTFDGDMLQCKLLLDNKEKALFSRLRPHLGLIDTDNARRIKGVHTLHPETITMINNFLYHNRMGQ